MNSARFLAVVAAPVAFIRCLTSPPRAATPVQLTTTGGVRPTASRDGNWVAYQAPGPVIVKIPSAGGAPIPLIAGGVEPNWERPGELIVFRGAGIYTVDATTLAVQPAYLGSGVDDDPV